jgi:hypothetical protein
VADTIVLVLGRLGSVVDAVRDLRVPGVEILTGTGLDDVRAALAGRPPDHVVMGAGLDLEVRLAIVREVFTRSTTTTVHLKDVDSGPAGLLPFARDVIHGLVGRPED